MLIYTLSFSFSEGVDSLLVLVLVKILICFSCSFSKGIDLVLVVVLLIYF